MFITITIGILLLFISRFTISCSHDSLTADDIVPTATLSVNNSNDFEFDWKSAGDNLTLAEDNLIPAEDLSLKYFNPTVIISQCINITAADVNINSIDFHYQYTIAHCGDKGKKYAKYPIYPSFKLYFVETDNYRNNYPIYQRNYNVTDLKLYIYCYDDNNGSIDAYSPLQTAHIDMNINLNYSIYQFHLKFVNTEYQSQLFLGTLSLRINAEYWRTKNTTDSDSSNPSNQLAGSINNILSIILGLALCLIICCCVAVRFGILYKRTRKKLKHYEHEYDYNELINITDPIEDGKKTKQQTLKEGEIDIIDIIDIIPEQEESIDENKFYSKPVVGTSNVPQQTKILHFYYMDYAEEGGDEKDDRLYHEKQELEMCLMHALNALVQTKTFTKQRMDEICKYLSPNKMINPHKSVLQTGNYDVNVLISALNKINIDVEWFDARNVDELDVNNDQFKKYLESEDNKFVGFILNVPSTTMFKMLTRRHWITIKKMNDTWYNLDSKLKSPYEYKNTQELTNFLVHNLATNKAELMICRKKKSKKQQHVEITW